MNLVASPHVGWSIERTHRFLRALPHPLLRRFAADLIELHFLPGPDQAPRWARAAFVNAVRLAQKEPEFARKLLAKPPRLLPLTPEALWTNLPPGDWPGNAALEGLWTAFQRCMAESQDAPNGATTDAPSPESHLAAWVTTATWCGLEAGLALDHLNVGYLLALTDLGRLSQRFIADRLLSLWPWQDQPRRPALISLVEFSYPATHLERAVITQVARELWRELRGPGTRLSAGHWIRGGFRAGMSLAWRYPALCRRLFNESPRSLHRRRAWFANFLGKEVLRWPSDLLVARSLNWLGYAYPELAGPVARPEQLEAICRLLDFAFWMGLLARE